MAQKAQKTKKAKKLTVAIIIPVYNEEHRIRACLEAVSRQTEKPDEVIVVDNNSTDRTIAIAQEFLFVKVITEKHQGPGNARTAGFNAAKSDILGRIDADSEIAPDWVAELRRAVVAGAQAVTGLGYAYTIPFPRLKMWQTLFWSRMYAWEIEGYFGNRTLWGANMAVTKKLWREVRASICLDDSVVHEDLDLSLLILSAGRAIIRDPRLLISTKSQSHHYLPKLMAYGAKRTTTRRHHQLNGTVPARQLSHWQTGPRRLFVTLVGVLFIATSLLLLPLDLVRKWHYKNLRWME